MGLVWIKALTLRTGHANVIGHVDRVLGMLGALEAYLEAYLDTKTVWTNLS